MAAAVKGPLKYTLKEYEQLAEAAQAKAAQLNEHDGESPCVDCFGAMLSVLAFIP